MDSGFPAPPICMGTRKTSSIEHLPAKIQADFLSIGCFSLNDDVCWCLSLLDPVWLAFSDRLKPPTRIFNLHSNIYATYFSDTWSCFIPKKSFTRSDVFFITESTLTHIFNFHPYLGKTPILANMFQLGWNPPPSKDSQWIVLWNGCFIRTLTFKW